MVITNVSVGPYTPTSPGSGGCGLTLQATLSGIVTGGLQAVAPCDSAGWTLMSYYGDRVARGQTRMTITSDMVFRPVDLQTLTSVRVNLWRRPQRNVAGTATYPVSWDATDCQPPS